MAEYTLIRDYLLAIDLGVQGRADAADLRDELSDHLHSAVDRLCAGGLDSVEAQRTALRNFGEPALVAQLLAAVPPKGSPMYTFFNRGASYFAFAAAALWVLAAAGFPFLQEALFPGVTETAYVTMVVMLAFAGLLAGLTLLAVNVRLAGSFDSVTTIVAALMVLAVASTVLAPWFLPAWLGLILAATSITLNRAKPTPLGNGSPSILLGTVWPILTIVVVVAAFVISTVSGVFTPELQDLIQAIALPAVCLVYAAGMVTLGLRLRTVSVSQSDRGPLIQA
ncbi:permease prefix domain 1-containing protein [Cryobacterium sp. PH31-L1]|uniref:permease prefix domain 1-containing protein n=1 Tax=Cryobacterium sp. PH31-L1 TaxID=3046199 RepID=UPI0024BA53A2|nr:permease prefix domain 1-containing protein [Cryobacterium sp. PH31-L1]MDJ0377820.1 permease prefix domain 1-containing protein [Cryobacterium sp. PH31-L1]